MESNWERSKHKNYSKEGTDDMDRMVQAIRAYRSDGGLDDNNEIVRHAFTNLPVVPLAPHAKDYNINVNTFRYRLIALSTGKEIGIEGGQFLLTNDEEEMVVQLCFFKHYAGFPMDNKHIQLEVNEFVKRKTGNNDYTGPSLQWIYDFSKRHKDVLSFRHSKYKDFMRATKPTRKNIELFYDLFCEILRLTGLNINDPNDRKLIARILWNADESGICLKNECLKVFCPRGERPVSLNLIKEKEYTTMLACGSAAGKLIKPLLIYRNMPGSGVPRDYKALGFDCEYYHNTCGWITREFFENWFENIFIPEALSQRPDGYTGPIILTFDQHSTHVGTNVKLLALKHNIKLLTFPAHCSHLLQPLDLNFFGPLKKKLALKTRNLLFKQPTVDKSDLAKLLEMCWSEIDESWLIKAFEMSGMLTSNGINRRPDQIKDDKLFTGVTFNGIIEYNDIFNLIESLNPSPNTLTADHFINSITEVVTKAKEVNENKQSKSNTVRGRGRGRGRGLPRRLDIEDDFNTPSTSLTTTTTITRAEGPELTPGKSPKTKKLKPKRNNKTIDFKSFCEQWCMICETALKSKTPIKCSKCNKWFHIQCIPTLDNKTQEELDNFTFTCLYCEYCRRDYNQESV